MKRGTMMLALIIRQAASTVNIADFSVVPRFEIPFL
jgi:hypothetical protein